jgi:hypothetical protein
MQTFLPYHNFERTMKVLDSRRLGKQRVEAFQILNIILNRTGTRGWRNHPAVKMWQGHANALKLYFNAAVAEWIQRGYKNTMEPEKIRGKIKFPKWVGNRKFHKSHKSNLVRKDGAHYLKFFGEISPDLEYVWPNNKV